MIDDEKSSPTPSTEPAAAAPTEVLRDLLQRGLITREEFDLRARTAQTSAGLEVERLLVERGFSPDVGPLSAPTDPGGAPPAAPSAPPRRLGKYALVREVGSGGMGAVYEARQDGLNRTVAVKVLHLDSTLAVERFRREGQALATLHHPNIVQVYEAGEEGGKSFLAMEFVEGPSLEGLLARGKDGKAPPRIDARQVGAWLAQVADALHHAHRAGIVHRDVKPANILLAPGDVPKLTDFGLAKKLDADWQGQLAGSKLTLSGALMGTPYYMAPEQAGGRTSEIDARTDVYALGVVLYQLLTGALPHVADEVSALLERIQSREPVRPRILDAGIPADLETIVLMCLEKEPRRRYESAALLAADLRRWLAGEPVMARRASVLYRLRRWIGRRVAVSLMTAALIIVGLGTVVVVRFMQRQVDEADRRARDVRSTVLYTEAKRILEVGLEQRRAGKTPKLQNGVNDVIRLADEALAIDPNRAEAHFVRGWALQLAQRTGEAIREFDEVLRLAPADPLTLYRRGVAYTGLSIQTRERRIQLSSHELKPSVQGLGTVLASSTPPRPLQSEASLYGSPRALDADATHAEQDFDRLPKETLADEARWQAAQGFRAMARAEYAQAEESFARALALDPESDEALIWRAKALHWMWTVGERQTSDLLSTLEDSIGENPGLQALFTLRAYLWNSEGQRLAADPSRWVEASGCWEKGVEDAARAIFLWPHVGFGELTRSDLRRDWGTALAARDALAANTLFRQSLEDAEMVVSAAPGWFDGIHTRGHALLLLAVSEAENDRDPRAGLAAAIRDFETCMNESPSHAFPLSDRAVARAELGSWEWGRQVDSLANLQAAVQDFDEVVKRVPGHAPTYRQRARTLMFLCRVRGVRGERSAQEAARSVEDSERALLLAPEEWEAYLDRGIARGWLGREAAGRGEDPSADCASALEDIARWLDRHPDDSEGLVSRAEVLEIRGAWKAGMGQDPTADFMEAIHCFDVGLETGVRDSRFLVRRAAVLCEVGQWKASRGNDPTAEYRRAIEDCDAATLDPRVALIAHVHRASARAQEGDRKLARNEDPSADFEPAIADYRIVLDRDPASGRGGHCRDCVHVRLGLARWKAAHGEDPSPQFEEGIQDLSAAIQTLPGMSSLYMDRARLWASLGDRRSAGSEDPSREYGAAIADLAKVVELEPESFAAHMNRGHLCEVSQRFDEALQEYEEAFRLSQSPESKAAADRVRARLPK